MSRLPNPFVFTKKTAFMQRLADLVRSGHHRIVQGEISLDKAGFLADKFNTLYGVELTKLEAFRVRQKGMATGRLLLWMPSDSAETLRWVLLVTAGQFKIDDVRERWKDPLEPGERLVIDGYELVRVTKAGQAKPAWTWRYTRKRSDEIRDAIVGAIRHRRDEDLKQIIHSLWRSPGFSGIRDQVKKFKELIKKEWKRSRSAAEAMPEIPSTLGYVRRLADTGKNLKELRASMAVSSGENKKKSKIVGQESDADVV